jgi:ATP-dependent helicase/nuclease subunit B
MGIVVVTSAANHDRLLFGKEWLKTKGPAAEVLIIGSTPVGANEITRSLIREKRAAFGYHRLSWAQFASTLARPVLTVQRTVPLGGLGVQAVANRASWHDPRSSGSNASTTRHEMMLG